MHLFLVIPPEKEPATLEELKAYLRISPLQEDSTLQNLLASARAYVEGVTGRALLRQQWKLNITPPYPPHSPLVKRKQRALEIHLPRPPLLEVAAVQTKGKDVPFTIENEKVLLSSALWDKEVSILYWAGYGRTREDLPPDLKTFVLMAAGLLYDNQKGALPLLNPYKVHRLL